MQPNEVRLLEGFEMPSLDVRRLSAKLVLSQHETVGFGNEFDGYGRKHVAAGDL
jgi:hypothetical protein